ncbi:hypothetical protein TELCIR_11049 [Teladorsagia circumcincta]|uniref:CLIP1 zinc knuckle domain-containing protein n=1 Tax=Teladorsagia circumcincta TaxID=45464 RepID=A0A2G9UAI3_TELCI|nr:hypothetical protein TELCIR_11049 [Teladorsagia circumcincta]
MVCFQEFPHYLDKRKASICSKEFGCSELLERQLEEQKRAVAEVKVQKAVAIADRTLSEENDDVPNVSTPSSNRRSSDEEHGYDYDDTYDDEEFKTEDLAPVSPRAEPTENKHTANTGEYCEYCSDYGHDTFSCESYLARRQGQRQTRHK